jgi:cytochrome c oxidase subunit 3
MNFFFKLINIFNAQATFVSNQVNMKMINKKTEKHPFHIVNSSPWPFFTGISCLVLTSGAILYMHKYSGGFFTFFFGLLLLFSSITFWWRDVIREATFEGHHTSYVQIGLKYGMLLFILSEIMFFFAFFWAFFHSSLVPTIAIGNIWPPKGILPINPWGIPLLNTFILLTSGATVTWAHHAIIVGKKEDALNALASTVGLALIFTLIQLMEYKKATFNISSGIYGTTFYMATGFHGFHVIIGSCFLIVCLFRLFSGHFTKKHHLGFEAAAWYWHFVDVVWLFLFISIYWWGGI